MLQYIDDLLICSPDEENAQQHAIQVLNFVAERGHKVSCAKAQVVQTKVTYLGFQIIHRSRRPTWILRRHPEIHEAKSELHPFFHMLLLSWALLSVKETNTHCLILGGHNIPPPFASASASTRSSMCPKPVTSLYHLRPSSP